MYFLIMTLLLLQKKESFLVHPKPQTVRQKILISNQINKDFSNKKLDKNNHFCCSCVKAANFSKTKKNSGNINLQMLH